MRRITTTDWKTLRNAALDAQRRAYAPYSRFKVGAALLTTTGNFIVGCNVENASYGLCLCAERNAISTAITQSDREFLALTVATSGTPPSPPCGLCLQMLAEFCLDLPIQLVNPRGDLVRTKLSRLLPHAFRWKGVQPVS